MNAITITNKEGVCKMMQREDFTPCDPAFRQVEKIMWQAHGMEQEIIQPRSFFPLFELDKIAVLPGESTGDLLVIYNGDRRTCKVIPVPAFINPQTIQESTQPKGTPGRFEVLEGVEQIGGAPHLVVQISTETWHPRMMQCLLIEKRGLDIQTWQWHPQWSIGGIYW